VTSACEAMFDSEDAVTVESEGSTECVHGRELWRKCVKCDRIMRDRRFIEAIEWFWDKRSKGEKVSSLESV